MGLQKHEKQAVAVMIETAREHGIEARPGEARNNKHPTNVVFTYGGMRCAIAVASSPRDKTWTVKAAGKKAKSVCRDLLEGRAPIAYMHV